MEEVTDSCLQEACTVRILQNDNDATVTPTPEGSRKGLVRNVLLRVADDGTKQAHTCTAARRPAATGIT